MVARSRYVDEVLPHAPWIIARTWIGKYNIGLVVQAMITSENTWKMFTKYQLRWEFFAWSLILQAFDHRDHPSVLTG